MLDSLRTLLAASPLSLLFLTIGSGYLLSHLKVRGVGLGVAAVLFVGLALGAWGGPAFALPELVAQFGLLLFVYSIGLAAGPSFFKVLKERGVAIAAVAAGAIGLAALATWGAAAALGLPAAMAAGLFCGAVTNTPALAAVTETLRGTPGAVLPTVGYSIAYPLGVIVPILLVEAAVRLFKIDVAAEARRAEASTGAATEAPAAVNLVVENRELAGRALGTSPLSRLGVRVSRVQHDGHVVVGTPSTVLAEGDVVRVVGTPAEVEKAKALIGPEVRQSPGPEHRRDEVDFRRVLLSNSALVGRRLGELHLEARYGALVTRVRRGDLDFVPTDDTVLQRGDRLRVVCRPARLPEVAAHLGDSTRAINETDFLSLSLGVVLGIALGALQLPLPGGLRLSLGLAGGPLLVALIVGYLGRTGPIIWSLPLSANMAFRNLGLVLFFAAVGLKAGNHFAGALAAQGPQLVLAGAIVTLVASIALMAGAVWLMKADFVTATGTLAGGQTQPALLTFAGERAHSEAPAAAYVAMMPLAMVAKIVLAQLLVAWLAR